MGPEAVIDKICVINRCPDLGKIVLDQHHQDVDFGISQTPCVSSREVVLCDYSKEDKNFLDVLLHEQEEQPSNEIKRLAISYVGIIKGKALKYFAQVLNNMRFILSDSVRVPRARIRPEMDVVGKGAIEVSLNGFPVVFVKFALSHTSYQGSIETRHLFEFLLPVGVVPPHSATPFGWEALPRIPSDLFTVLGKPDGF